MREQVSGLDGGAGRLERISAGTGAGYLPAELVGIRSYVLQDISHRWVCEFRDIVLKTLEGVRAVEDDVDIGLRSRPYVRCASPDKPGGGSPEGVPKEVQAGEVRQLKVRGQRDGLVPERNARRNTAQKRRGQPGFLARRSRNFVEGVC